MYAEKSAGQYDRFPTVKIPGFSDEVYEGYPSILRELKRKINHKKYTIILDCYPGIRDEEVCKAVEELKPSTLILTEKVFKDREIIAEQMKYNLTEDRVFGRMYHGEIIDFMEESRLNKARKEAEDAEGLTVIYGFGASLIAEGDLLVYLDLSRWEIQLRYRNGMGNYKADNGSEDVLKKFKRAYFIEWRIADKHKNDLLASLDYLLDTNRKDHPKMVSGLGLRSALHKLACEPFRTVPYFDPGVWGGQWMKEVCGLEKDKENFAWSFDGVPEENSLLLDFEGTVLEIPAMDLVLYEPKKLLGEQVFARFGAEFPIRFDLLDTMGGQNLSLQVHPLKEYIKKQFGMDYTQDESYYILDAEEGAVVYLGLKDAVDQSRMISDLKKAQEGQEAFSADQYVNCFPAKKHDHFLIPAGTCHCSGRNTMVLEISATPYIFTFKLWDWGRLGLDGKPRPIHIEHGENVIQWDRTTEWVRENLINRVEILHDQDGYVEERTGLHALEFIETRRYWFTSPLELDTNGTVHMLNLVEGSHAVIEAPNGEFEPFSVHYAETFIVPASVGKYRICPVGGEKTGLINAYVR